MARAKLTFTRKKILIGVTLAALLVAGGVLFAAFINRAPEAPEEEPKEFTMVVTDVQVGAANYLNNGDVEGGLKYYDEHLEQYETDEEKKVLLTLKSGFARMAERYDMAIGLARQADEMGSDVDTTRALAQAYRSSGDREQALVHYRKLLELRQAEEGESDPNRLYESRSETLGSIIRELEQ